MGWSKDTTHDWAVDYRESFLKDPTGVYTDHSEQRPVLGSFNWQEEFTVLDAGCGTGRYLKALSTRARGIGLDLSREMLKMAAEEAPGCNFVVGLTDRLPFCDDAFDAVISVRVLQHVRDQAGAIRELARVCRPGGRVVVLALNSWTLHCLYKNLRMGRRQRWGNVLWGRILGRKSPFRPWTHSYDNYSSLPELRRMFRAAGLEVTAEKGGTIGAPWVFNYFHIHRVFGRHANGMLARHFISCERWESRLESSLFKYFMDKVIVVGARPVLGDVVARRRAVPISS